MRLNIRVNRFYWVRESILFFVIGTGASVFVLVVGLVADAPGSIWAVLVGIVGIIISLYLSIRDLYIAFSEPYITLDTDRIDIRLPFIFRSDLALERSQVRALTFGPVYPYGRPSKHSPLALALKRSPKLWSPLHRESGRFSSLTLPDLSGLGWFQPRTFIILLTDPLLLRNQVRRWLVLPNLYAPGDYCGPTRASVAHGFCAELADLTDPQGTREWLTSMSWEVVDPEGIDGLVHEDH